MTDDPTPLPRPLPADRGDVDTEQTRLELGVAKPLRIADFVFIGARVGVEIKASDNRVAVDGLYGFWSGVLNWTGQIA